MSFPKYPEYKDSGVEWLGEVPSHWSKTALKYLGEYYNGYPFKPEDRGEDGLPIIRIAQLTGGSEPAFFSGCVDERNKVNDGELLFSWSATIDSFIWKGGSAWLNQHIFKVTPSEEADKKFLYYVIKHVAPKLADFDAHGSTMRHIKRESLDQRLYVPATSEQAHIASFLDHETARIDALVEEQQHLIKLLKEKRQAVISRAVTKGLDPDVPMKDSGVEWLGEVPAHWMVGPLRWYATIQGGVAKGKSYDASTPAIDLPYLRVANVQDGYVDLSSVKTVTVAVSEIDRYRLQSGDVLMSEGGDNDKLGRGAVWGGEIADCLHQNHVFAIRPNDHLLPHWLSMFTGSNAARSYFYLYSKQSTNLASVSSSNVMSCPLPLPPREEQLQILDFLGRETARIDNLMVEGEKAISFLHERRSALISAAVTGKIDVRGWQANQQPEQPEVLMAAEARATYG